MDNINKIILEHLRSGGKTAGELKDASDCSYSILDKALRTLIDAEEIEPGWSNDDLPVRIYKLKRQKESAPFWRI
ncbi:hypothetical protein ACEYW6_28320 [Nostoc sp. UIC 10607]|uniref:hypothetical protein n=1 Tax=Nostoc sp. UIC 10607 TaxID=3045935 RepID=UPI00399FDE66